jgi:Tetracyclin repressor-like, C-terminal domain
LARVALAVGLPQPRLRSALAGSTVFGLAMARYVVRLEPIASADVDSLVAWYAPTLQRYLAEPLPGDGRAPIIGCFPTVVRSRRSDVCLATR